ILPASDLAAMLEAARQEWSLAPGAEVTTEANPDTVDEAYAQALAAAGFTRMSIGMQSAVPHVLATLDRTHTPANVERAVAAARRAGLQVSLDLIYGAPGESAADWRASLDAALALEPDHISAYALGIEPGTKMGAQLRRGEIEATDPNVLAEMYEQADDALVAAGYAWYEISNWARGDEFRCRHNLAYWRDADWWGIGPGAHSHAGSARWWNVKHPRPYAERVAAGELPIADREDLSADSREFERIMLGVRLAEGLAPPVARTAEWDRAVATLVMDGLAEDAPAEGGVVVLTRTGRLQADAVTRLLTDL
ncbi:MAG: radical SAM protein, partial [Ruaniaceae bacterium]|nr:radical SAM protein [Ruaniaceae bacterium]